MNRNTKRNALLGFLLLGLASTGCDLVAQERAQVWYGHDFSNCKINANYEFDCWAEENKEFDMRANR